MEYLTIPIVESARRCGISVGRTDRAEVEVKCPFCGDHKRHMSLNTRKNVFRCNRCGESGNSVTLYAKIMNLDTKSAYRELSNSFVTRIPVLRGNAAPAAHCDIKPLPERHNVYYDMLDMLRLSGKHRQNLLNRGLSHSAINKNMYRSMPERNSKAYGGLAYWLSQRHDLQGVPGFYYKGGSWRFVHKDGLLIPALDKDGYIQGLQIRLDDESNRKYRWFSSNHYDYGAKARPWIHVAGKDGSKKAYITEGALKADAASFFTDSGCFVALSGVNCIDGLTGVLAEMGITEVIEAFDMDKTTNANVAKALAAMKRELISAGFGFRSMTWNPQYKGIDDYLLAMRQNQHNIAA